jgi:DNA-binding MarR family transcriptional regulator
MDDTEVRAFRSQLLQLQRRLRHEPRPVPGLSGTELRVLGAIGRLSPGVQPGQVADELRMTSSNVAAALRKLDHGGHIRRERDDADGRRVQLVLTKAGEKVVAAVRAERDTWLGRAVDGLLDEKEQRQLLRAGRLIQRLAEFESGEP